MLLLYCYLYTFELFAGLSDAGKLVIHCLGYTGTGYEDEDIGSIDKELSLSAIAVEPDEVIWLKVRWTIFNVNFCYV